MNSSSTKRIVDIDILRGISVLLVILDHGPIDHPIFRGGWVGVDLFFVLSGFLVSGLLFTEFTKTGKIKPLHFLIRRGFKIYPVFYLFIGGSVAITLATQTYYLDTSLEHLLPELFFVQNYWKGFWPHTWTLAVEEHFYFGFTLLLWAVLTIQFRRPVKKESHLEGINLKRDLNPFYPMNWIPWFSLSVMGICLSLRIATHYATPFDIFKHYMPSHLRIDSLMLGVLVSWLFHFREKWLLRIREKTGKWLWIPSLFFLSTPFGLNYSDPFIYTFGFSLISISTGIVIIYLVLDQPFSKLSFPLKSLGNLIAEIGYYSYSIYLVHFAVIKCMLWFLKSWDPWLIFPVYILVSLVGGVLVSKWIEWPMLRLRNRWFPSRA